MRRVANLSNLLAAALIPLCAWGLIATLMLHLIEVRSVFIAGGEGRLRQGVLAFALGVVLVQRLSASQGRSLASAYGWVLGAAMALFAAHQAYAYRIPGIHPILVFLVNGILFGILWWVGNTITAACSVDSEYDHEDAAESGVLYRTSRQWRQLTIEKPEEKSDPDKDWTERLPGRHPGRVIFYFSLVAVPIFTLGMFLFTEERAFARIRAGIFLFTYLWCAFALLSLSQLRQLSVYFAKRGVSLPEMIGLTWLSIAAVITIMVLVAAVFLPQPPSLPGYFVRERVLAHYYGWSAKHGMKDTVAGPSGEGSQGGGGAEAESERSFAGEGEVANKLESRMQNIDRMGDKQISETARNSGFESRYRSVMTGIGKMNDGFRKFFDFLLKALFVVLILCCPIILFMMLGGAWQSMAAKGGGLRRLRRLMGLRREEKEKKKKRAGDLESRRYYGIRNPFDASYRERDGDEIVRACWEALLAFCADFGTPSSPDQTPLEFVYSGPEALEGFEEHAHFIASLFTFSEFSGQAVSDEVKPALKEFWGNLERHARETGV